MRMDLNDNLIVGDSMENILPWITIVYSASQANIKQWRNRTQGRYELHNDSFIPHKVFYIVRLGQVRNDDLTQ